METKDNIFGCFFSVGFDSTRGEEDSLNLANKFRPYIWGETGISDILKKIRYTDYEVDIKLILFEFYVLPTQQELQQMKYIGQYRKNEKSIGIPIVVTNDNFFDRSEVERYAFLKAEILAKMDLLSEVVKKKKLDTKIDLLKADLNKIL